MYFTWTQHSFRRPPELDGGASDFDVAIVGGGPVGLAAALALARLGVRAVVLEAGDTVSDGSRAIGTHRRTTQFMDWLGIGDAFVGKAIARERNIVFHGTRTVYETLYETPASEKHPVLLCLQQCWTEQLLLDAIAAEDLAEIRWLSRATGIENRADGVTLSVETPEGAYVLRAAYVIAADGARGAARRLFDLPYESPVADRVSDRQFVICDFTMKAGLSPGRRLWLDPPTRPGSIVLMHAQPFDVWRLDYAVEDGEDAEFEATPERAAQRIAAHLAMMGIEAPWELLWTTVYRPLARTLPTYDVGRTFFAGDAAHQTPIFGGRGLNLGFADVFNLAWKLAYVLQGKAPATLLDSYTPERKAILSEALEDLAQATIFMTRPSPGVALMRDAALSLTETEDFVAELFDAYRARRGEAYPNSPLSSADPDDGPVVGEPEDDGLVLGGPVVGGPLPDARLVAGDGTVRHLHDLLHRGFTLLCFSGDGRLPDGAQARLRRLADGPVPFAPLVIGRSGGGDGSLAVRDPDGTAFDLFGAADGCCWLVRPDFHVAARWRRLDPDAVETALHRAVGRGDPAGTETRERRIGA